MCFCCRRFALNILVLYLINALNKEIHSVKYNKTQTEPGSCWFLRVSQVQDQDLLILSLDARVRLCSSIWEGQSLFRLTGSNRTNPAPDLQQSGSSQSPEPEPVVGLQRANDSSTTMRWWSSTETHKVLLPQEVLLDQDWNQFFFTDSVEPVW